MTPKASPERDAKPSVLSQRKTSPTSPVGVGCLNEAKATHILGKGFRMGSGTPQPNFNFLPLIQIQVHP
jgi:hypothetical protein